MEENTRRKNRISNSDSSEDSGTTWDSHSSESEEDTIDPAEEFTDDPLEFSNLAAKVPEIGDSVLVMLTPVNSSKKLYYVAKICDKFSEDDNLLFDVEFFRQTRKMKGRFIQPEVKDWSRIAKTDIVMCLPKPLTAGGTKRVASMIQFGIDLEQ